MNDTPITSRTWIDPGWGKIVHRVGFFRHSWQKSEWYNHLGVQGVLWAGAILLSLGVASIIDVLLGILSFDEMLWNIVRLKFIVELLGGGFAIALLVRWVEYMGWLEKSVHTSQAEVYTNGLYLAPYGFVSGLHPFFVWSDIKGAEVSVHKSRRYVMLSLKLRELKQAGYLKLDADAVAELLAIPEVGGKETLLAEALRQAAAALKAR